MYGSDILCEISMCTFEIPHKISNPFQYRDASYQYKGFHYKDKTVSQSSYIIMEISHLKRWSSNWEGAQLYENKCDRFYRSMPTQWDQRKQWVNIRNMISQQRCQVLFSMLWHDLKKTHWLMIDIDLISFCLHYVYSHNSPERR